MGIDSVVWIQGAGDIDRRDKPNIIHPQPVGALGGLVRRHVMWRLDSVVGDPVTCCNA